MAFSKCLVLKAGKEVRGRMGRKEGGKQNSRYKREYSLSLGICGGWVPGPPQTPASSDAQSLYSQPSIHGCGTHRYRELTEWQSLSLLAESEEREGRQMKEGKEGQGTERERESPSP